MVDHHRSSPLVSGRAGTPEPSQTKFLQLGAVTICQAAPIPRPLGLATPWRPFASPPGLIFHPEDFLFAYSREAHRSPLRKTYRMEKIQ